MPNAALRPLFFILVIAVLAPSMVYLFVDNRALRHKNRDLMEESRKLQAALDEIGDKDKALIDALEKDKKGLKDSLESLKKEHASLQSAVQKAEQEANQAREEKTYLEDILISKTKEIEKLKAGGPAGMTAPDPGDSAELVEKIRQKTAEVQQREEQNKVLADKLEKLDQTAGNRITEIGVAKTALEDTVNLGSIRMGREPDAPPSPAPKTLGHVLAINEEHGFVVVDLGKVDNLQAETELEVQHDGKPIAKLNVLEIRDVMSACNIRDLETGQKIQINDLVSIHR